MKKKNTLLSDEKDTCQLVQAHPLHESAFLHST